MTETSHELINEYKDQVSELESAGKSKDSANKRCLQKLEYANEDLEKAQNKIKDLEKKLKDTKKTNKMLVEHP